MKNIFFLAQNTLKVTFRKKLNIIVYIIIPIVIVMGLIGIMGNYSSANITMGIVNKDNTVLSKDMINYFESTGKFKIIEIDEKDISEKVAARSVDFAFIVPKSFSNSIYNGNPKKIEIISIKGQEVTAWIESYTEYYIRNLKDIYTASNGNKNLFNKIYEEYNLGGFKFTTDYVKDTSMNKEATQSVVGMFIMFIMISCSTTSSIMLKEKRNRTYHRICTAPVSTRMYIFSNIIVNLFIVFIQIITILMITEKIMKFETYVPTLQMIIILMGFGLNAVALGMIITAFSNSTNTSSVLTSLIVTPTCMLGGCFWPISLMPETVQKISNFIPQTWALDAIKKIQSGSSFSNIILNIIILLGFATVFFLIAVYKMKKSNDITNFV